MLPDGFSGKDWREWRRLRALQLKERGWSLRDIAEALGVAEPVLAVVTSGQERRLVMRDGDREERALAGLEPVGQNDCLRRRG